MASRTLVKSPPELWAECSDAASLARHLDQFGEIKITRLDPETAVAWEGERARGTVRIEPAGWGTKVVLTAVAVADVTEQKGPTAEHSDVVEPEAVEPEVAEPDAVEPRVVEPQVAEPEVVEPEVTEPAIEDTEAVEAPKADEPVPEVPEVVAPRSAAAPPRRRRFSRLFRFRREPPSVMAERRLPVESEQPVGHEPAPHAKAEPIAEPEPSPESTPEPPPESTPEATFEPKPEALSEPTPKAISEPTPRAISEPTPEAFLDPTISETAPEATEAALTAALDSLGQAHHRPYSRA